MIEIIVQGDIEPRFEQMGLKLRKRTETSIGIDVAEVTANEFEQLKSKSPFLEWGDADWVWLVPTIDKSIPTELIKIGGVTLTGYVREKDRPVDGKLASFKNVVEYSNTVLGGSDSLPFITGTIGALAKMNNVKMVDLVSLNSTEDHLDSIRQVSVDYFKESGKWYTRETISVPVDVRDWELNDYIKENSRIKDMSMLFIDSQGIQHLIVGRTI